ncbi:MAG: hypothetical protein P9L95_02310, partial [Candidatus Tenebribacter mawsonii]|nr:hypothetical protein [Candidatus Tenebribacter mawsonii]
MTKLNELINKLEELFELDKTDLDFGIYRIVKQRQNRIKDFLNKKLPIKVQTILGKTNAEEQADELQKYKAECISSFGQIAFEENGQLTEMFAQTPAGKRYSDALKKSQNKSVSTQLETEVYSHLLDFFSRYYQDGDFISQRRSAVKDKYAIPYNGEEVVMHWANKDQYYIKSSENLKDYVFTLGTGNAGILPANMQTGNEQISGQEVHSPGRLKFRLAGMDAVKDNNKAKRQMVLYKEADGKYDEEGIINIEQNENNLVIPFYFKEVKKALTQKQHLESLENEITELLDENWKNILLANDNTFAGKDSRTILAKHLLSYIRKQTSDFFIHKDLGGFLKNELDFYIKNEVMYLDDV